jgi:Tol biopolymer transport system component
MTRNLLKIYLLVAMVILTCLSCNNSQKNNAPAIKEVSEWKYFGLPSPGNVPQVFSPEIISTNRNERDFAITPAGNIILYSIVFPADKLSVIIYLAFDGFFWSEPECAAFSGIYKDLEPAFSPDGKKLFFVSNRPLNGNTAKKDYDIWIVEPEKGWNLAVNAGSPVNSDEDEYYPSVASNGNLYFTAKYSDSFGKEDIYVSRFENGSYRQPVNLGETINTENYEFNAFIAPDESYLIFSSYGREDDLGGGDLYISFKNGMNIWSIPKNLGNTINSDKLDYCPFVTPDGKFLFFTSERTNAEFGVKSQKKLENLLQMADGIENGLGNIYWVTFDKNVWQN